MPHFVQDKSKPSAQQYKLLYSPFNVFIFLIYFYSIYERVIKAQAMVKQKVD